MSNITYELAVKLKEAGFPQDKRDINSELESWWTPDGALIIPSLSELIEECGDGFVLLYHIEGKFSISGREKNGSSTMTEVFSTPEEAVANLYLELNK